MNCTETAEVQDFLDYLPRSKIEVYKEGEMINDQGRPATFIFLLLKGLVKISRNAGVDNQSLVDIYVANEFFGEPALMNGSLYYATATALIDTVVMMWTTGEMEKHMANRPLLSMGMMQVMIKRTNQFKDRIESFSTDEIPRRLVRALIRFSERIGTFEEDGTSRIIPITHTLLAQYIGTTRERVTIYMSQLKREKYLGYSRDGIVLYPKIHGWMNEQK